MAIKNQQLNIVYTAWNTNSNGVETGDVANHDIYISKDGGSFVAVTNSPSELGTYGEYTLLLTDTEMNANFIKIIGTSSTANVIIIPIIIVTESGIIIQIKNYVSRVDALIEDVSGDRFTTKALETGKSDATLANQTSIASGISTILSNQTDIKSKVDIIDTVVDSIQVDTNSIETKIDTIDTVVDSIQIDTNRVDALIENVSGDRFTTKALEQAPSGGGGGGDATAANQTTIINNLATIETKIDTIDTVVDSIQVDTNSIETKIDTIDTVVDSIQVDTNSIESKVDTVDTVVDGIAVETSRVDSLIENVSGDRFTTKALEQAPSGSGGGGDATAANQLTIITHLTDVKGTGFIKDTNSLTNLSAGATTNISVDATIIEVD